MPVRSMQRKGAETGHSRRSIDEARQRIEVRTLRHVASTGFSHFVMSLNEEKEDAGEEEWLESGE